MREVSMNDILNAICPTSIACVCKSEDVMGPGGITVHLKAEVPTRPHYSVDGPVYAQCWDLRAYVSPADYPNVFWANDDRGDPQPGIVVERKKRMTIRTGLTIQLPNHMGAVVRPRSGLAKKNGVMILGGEIDPAYRGDISIIMYNSGTEDLRIVHGMRIAQIRLIVCWDALRSNNLFVETSTLESTDRGDRGFGSTGL